MAPDWFGVRAGRMSGGAPTVTGGAGVDEGWLAAVTSICAWRPAQCPLITPRFVVELRGLGGAAAAAAARAIGDEAAFYRFDGVLLEWRGAPADALQQLADMLHNVKTPAGRPMVLILAVEPSAGGEVAGAPDRGVARSADQGVMTRGGRSA